MKLILEIFYDTIMENYDIFVSSNNLETYNEFKGFMSVLLSTTKYIEKITENYYDKVKEYYNNKM